MKIMPTELEKQQILIKVKNHPQGLMGVIEREQHFQTKLTYPQRKDYNIKRKCTECGETHSNLKADKCYHDDMRKYRDDQARLFQLFKYAALTYCDIAFHPKADKAFSMAWDKGHSSGYYEVLNELEILAELMKED